MLVRRHCFNLVDFGCGLSWAYFPYQWAPYVASGHVVAQKAHEVEGYRLGLQPPRQTGLGLEARPEGTRPAFQPVGRGRFRGVPVAAHQLVPAFREVPQQLPHLRPQAPAALRRRVPGGQQDGSRLRQSLPG